MHTPIRYLLVTVLTALLLSDCFAAEPRTQSAPDTEARVRSWLEENIPELMTESRMPGFAIAVVKDGATIYAEGFGARDPQRNLPATADTLFGVGSITKSFVAIGIMQLVEQGKIALDDPVRKHVPFQLGRPDHPITIHHLLTHSLGIPSLASSTVALHRGLGHDTGIPLASADDFYRFVNGAQQEVVARPGRRFFYHNAAWRMLGHIIQVRSGMPFHQYLKRNVINPLGMQRTTLNVAAFQSDADRIVPHLKKSGGSNRPAEFPYPNPADNPDFSFIAAAGGVISSAREMTRYLNAWIEQGAYGGGRLASRKSFAKMQQLHIRRPAGHHGPRGYGYGLNVTPDFLGHKRLSHGGSIIVSTANMAFVPELRAGVVMLGNSSGMPYDTIAQCVLALLAGENPDQAVPVLQIKRRMRRLEGTYEVYRGLDRVKVRSKGGLLYLETTSRLSGSTSLTPLIPDDLTLAKTTFYTLSNGIKSPVEFRLRDSGATQLLRGRYCYRRTQP